MTQEQKAKAYDEVLNKLRRYMAQGVDPLITRADVQDFFPELKESEDERIKKELIDFFQDWHKVKPSRLNVNVSDILAWLEKQEQKPTDEEMKTLLRIEYEKGKADAIAEMQKLVDCTDCTNSKGCINCEDGNMEETLVQEPAWSEEDERMFERILQQFIIANNDCKLHNASFTYDKEISFLKSLRPQNRWKPSDEQMKALEHFVRSIGESGYASPYDNNTNKLLYSLLSDLKKLKGE